MSTYGITEAKAKFLDLVEAAAKGEEVVITRRGKPVAMIIAIAKPKNEDFPKPTDEDIIKPFLD